MPPDTQNPALPAAEVPACPNTTPSPPAKPKKRQRGRSRKQRLRQLREQMLAEQGTQCSLCGCEMITGAYRPNTATLDHIVPRARGGTDVPGNLRLACMRCNSTRHHQLADPATHARALAAIAANKARCQQSLPAAGSSAE